MKNLWDRWFWKDFEGDAALRRCGHVAGSIWMRMLAIMATGERPGYLLPGNAPIEDERVHEVLSIQTSKEEALAALKSLEQYGVFSRTLNHPQIPDGVIYCRRMVRFQEKRSKMQALAALAVAARQRKQQERGLPSPLPPQKAIQPRAPRPPREDLVQMTQDRIDAKRRQANES